MEKQIVGVRLAQVANLQNIQLEMSPQLISIKF